MPLKVDRVIRRFGGESAKKYCRLVAKLSFPSAGLLGGGGSVEHVMCLTLTFVGGSDRVFGVLFLTAHFWLLNLGRNLRHNAVTDLRH